MYVHNPTGLGQLDAVRQVQEAARVEIERLERECRALTEEAEQLRGEKAALRKEALEEHG
jgi:cell division protein FtsB